MAQSMPNKRLSGSAMWSSLRKQWSNRWLQVASGVVVVVIVFVLGVNVGNGSLQVSLLPGVVSQNTSLPSTLDYSTVNDVYTTLKDNYDGKLTVSQLLDGLKEGLAASTNDPYTEYFNATQAKAFEGELNNSFSGVGAELGKDNGGNLIVVSPIKGFPADQAGLKAQDIITSINGESTTGMEIDAAVNKIRGPEGTKVTLAVVRNHAQALTFTITRTNIKLPSVTTKTLDGNIGYMQIISFSDDTVTLAQQAADQFKAAGVKGVILDLRGNPGGALDAAIGVSSLWLPSGTTILTEKGTDGTQTYAATGDDSLNGVPTVVLIDGGSASASEITAGALHDNKVARLIGVKSYGKGVVQKLIPLKDGSELKVTIASWYRPNGQNINKQGITPDQTVNVNATDAAKGNDTQLQAAEDYLNK